MIDLVFSVDVLGLLDNGFERSPLGNLSEIRVCGLALLSLNNLAKHEKEERRERVQSAHTPRKMTGSGIGMVGARYRRPHP